MVSIKQERRFLGVTFSAFFQAWAQLARQVFEMPVFAWFSPAVLVKVMGADGAQTRWRVGARLEIDPKGAADAARFIAIEIPEDLVLIRHLSFSGVPPTEISQALELEAHASSPFPLEDLLWGSGSYQSAEGRSQCCLVMASRRKVEAILQEKAAKSQSGLVPEAWVIKGLTEPVVFTGFGEGRRIKWMRLARLASSGLVVTALILVAAICVTPSLQLYLRGLDAIGAFADERQRTQALAEKRASYLGSIEQLHEITKLTESRVNPLSAMDRLTRVIPDDTHVQSMQVNGSTVTLAGQTSNAASLMQYLGTQPGIEGVKALSASTRALGLSKDSFSIEFSLAPTPLAGVSSPALAASAPALAASKPLQASSKVAP